MTAHTRTFTFADATDALGSEVETEIDGIVDAFNNHEAGTSSFTKVKAEQVLLNSDPAGNPVANTIYKANVVKGWVKFDGTGTPSITDSFNVAAIDDNGTGDYGINWTTDFANINYAVAGNAGYANGMENDSTANTVGIANVAVHDLTSATAARADSAICTVIAIGDQ